MAAAPRILRATVGFDVSGDAPHRALTRATEEAEAAARAALPDDATVRAEGALGSVREGRRRVRVALTVSGADAEAAWVDRARDAFGAAFLASLAKAGHDDARRVA